MSATMLDFSGTLCRGSSKNAFGNKRASLAITSLGFWRYMFASPLAVCVRRKNGTAASQIKKRTKMRFDDFYAQHVGRLVGEHVGRLVGEHVAEHEAHSRSCRPGDAPAPRRRRQA